MSRSEAGEINKTYDAGGNLLTVVDAKGQTTKFSYDIYNRVSQTQVDNQTTLYWRDPLGRLVSASSDRTNTEIHRRYDGLGNLIVEHQHLDGDEKSIWRAWHPDMRGYTLTYPYGHTVEVNLDVLGRVTGTGAGTSRLIYEYAGADRVKAVLTGTGHTTIYEYDQGRRPISKTIYGGTNRLSHSRASYSPHGLSVLEETLWLKLRHNFQRFWKAINDWWNFRNIFKSKYRHNWAKDFFLHDVHFCVNIV